MISFFAYKDVHIIAVLGLFLAFGAIIAEQVKARWAAMLHGLALLVILISGFGMLARLGFAGSIPGWALGKLAIWLLMGGSIVLARRKLLPTGALILLLLALGGTAAGLALWKP